MRLPRWAWIAAAAFAVLGILFFFQTRDPMILVFAVVAGGTLLVALLLVALLRDGVGAVRVKCRACGGLNLEDARFCSQCGQQP